jgi:hypothetical protein
MKNGKPDVPHATCPPFFEILKNTPRAFLPTRTREITPKTCRNNPKSLPEKPQKISQNSLQITSENIPKICWYFLPKLAEIIWKISSKYSTKLGGIILQILWKISTKSAGKYPANLWHFSGINKYTAGQFEMSAHKYNFPACPREKKIQRNFKIGLGIDLIGGSGGGGGAARQPAAKSWPEKF